MTQVASHPAASLEFLSRLHDGELPADEAAAFESHRGTCAECREAVVDFERALSLFREAPTATAAADLSARILKKIRAVSPSRRPFGVMFGIDIRWAGALAAALLVVLIFVPAEFWIRRTAKPSRPAPVSSAPISAYLLDAEKEPSKPEPSGEKRANAAPAEPRSDGRLAEKKVPAAPPAIADKREGDRKFAQKTLSAPKAAAERDELAAAAPPPPPAVQAEVREENVETGQKASADTGSRRRTAQAPLGGEAGAAGSLEEETPAVRLRVRAIDGQGEAPELLRTPSDERLAPLRGREFILIVETGGRVHTVETRPVSEETKKDQAAAEGQRSGADRPELILKELAFQPGDRFRRLLVQVQ